MEGQKYPQGQQPQHYPQGGQPPQYAQGQQPQAYYNPGQQQQQPSSVVVVTQPQRAYTSFTCAIVLSCLVFWCCGWIFGLVAFILAMVGQSSAASGDEAGAIQLQKASYGVSIAGIIIGVILLIVVIVVMVAGTAAVVSEVAKCQPVGNCYDYGYYLDGFCRKCCTAFDVSTRHCMKNN
jgi:uncharacterized membrane protein